MTNTTLLTAEERQAMRERTRSNDGTSDRDDLLRALDDIDARERQAAS
jgi:hypothetical protein